MAGPGKAPHLASGLLISCVCSSSLELSSTTLSLTSTAFGSRGGPDMGEPHCMYKRPLCSSMFRPACRRPSATAAKEAAAEAVSCTACCSWGRTSSYCHPCRLQCTAFAIRYWWSHSGQTSFNCSGACLSNTSQQHQAGKAEPCSPEPALVHKRTVALRRAVSAYRPGLASLLWFLS